MLDTFHVSLSGQHRTDSYVQFSMVWQLGLFFFAEKARERLGPKSDWKIVCVCRLSAWLSGSENMTQMRWVQSWKSNTSNHAPIQLHKLTTKKKKLSQVQTMIAKFHDDGRMSVCRCSEQESASQSPRWAGLSRVVVKNKSQTPTAGNTCKAESRAKPHDKRQIYTEKLLYLLS